MIDETDNPYSTYRVQFPYTCSFTIPDDGHDTRVTIESKSEVLRYGKDEEDIQLQMQLDLEQFLTYLGTSFGFLAAYIVYRDTIKKM